MYEVIESKVWNHKITGRTVSIYGACPWVSSADKDNWELITTGWTVRNPYTNEVGVCRLPWKTRQEAEEFAATHTPSKTLMYD